MKNRHFQLPALILALGLALAPGQVFAAAHGSHGGGHGMASSRADERIYVGTGVIESIDAAAKVAVIKHDPIPALNWPAMTMNFQFDDASMMKGLKAGDKVRFDFRNRGTSAYLMDIEGHE